MNVIVRQTLAARLETACRRHPILMFIFTLILAVVAIGALLNQDQATIILYQAF
jgi:hypothetical protein